MPDEYVVLHHPPTGVTHTFTKRREPIKRRDGWVDPPERTTTADRQPESPEVTRSSVSEVLDWVDGDRERAETAREAEWNREHGPRSTLIEALDRIVNEEE